jgi:hypothetical protein
MVEFILPGSTTAFKKMPPCQRDGARLHFGTPLKEDQKHPDLRIADVKLRLGTQLGRASSADPPEHGLSDYRTASGSAPNQLKMSRRVSLKTAMAASGTGDGVDAALPKRHRNVPSLGC